MNLNDPQVQAWATDVIDNMAPKLRESAMVVSLVPDNRLGDAKFWVELGASICMNKPIVLVAFGLDAIPPKMEAVADEIVRLPKDANLSDHTTAFMEAVQRVLKDG